MIDKLKPGMEKNQVRAIMGTPALADPFHPDRWEYIYTFTKGAEQRQQRRVTIYFEDEKLTYVEGDIKGGVRKTTEELNRRSKIVDVPLIEYRRKGLIESLVTKIPFIGNDEAKAPDMDDVIEAGSEASQKTEQTSEQAEVNDDESSQPQEDADKVENEKKQKGFFGRMLDRLPIIGDSEEASDSGN